MKILSKLMILPILVLLALPVSCQKTYTVPRASAADAVPRCGIFHFEDNPYDNMTDIDLKASYIVEQFELYGDIPKYTNKIIITTFVDINNLNKTTMFGRLIAEQILSQLHMKGYRVSDIRETKSIVMADKVGELYLSREGIPDKGAKINVVPRNFNFNYTGSLIVAGTYQIGPCDVFVNARLISPETTEVLSIASVKIPRTRLIKYLLSKKSELKIDEPMPTIRLRQSEPPSTVKAVKTATKVKKKAKRKKVSATTGVKTVKLKVVDAPKDETPPKEADTSPKHEAKPKEEAKPKP
ncbi:MAG: hypothetical protein HQL01_07800 [Nitrospirae bacterium]|nr:hypothetical protein [Nitrospirota bacterium]